MSQSHYDEPHDRPDSAGAAMGLGIAALVIGIVALLFSFIPCFGMYAIWPGGLAVLLGGTGLWMSVNSGKVSGLAIAGLSVSLVACAVAAWQYQTWRNAPEKLKEIGKEVGDEFEKGFKESERRRKVREAERKRKEEERKREAERQRKERESKSNNQPPGGLQPPP